jgi:ABC-2 type transport system permease protein
MSQLTAMPERGDAETDEAPHPRQTGIDTTPLLSQRAERPTSLQSNLSLVRELAVTSFKLKYAGSVLGYIWSLAKPLMIFGTLYLFFVEVVLRGRTPASENFPVELLVGIVLWTFFADATSTALFSVATNGDMLRKARFPRWILVVASTASASLTFVVNFALILAIGLPLGWYVLGPQSLWLPLLVVELFVLSLGVGFFLAAFYVYYRDLAHIWEVLLQLLFFASAIIYPFSLIPPKYQWIIALNPATQIVEDVRRAIVSPGIPWSIQLLGWKLSVTAAAVLLSVAVGGIVFRRMSRHFGERV